MFVGAGVVLCNVLKTAAGWVSSLGSVGSMDSIGIICVCTLSLLVWLMHVRATKAEAKAKQALARQEETSKSVSGSTVHGQADNMAGQGEPRAEQFPNPRALVHALLDMLQNGEVPPDRDLDLLRGLLVESQEVGLPSTLVEMLQQKFPSEPAVEDSILFTLGQRPLFPAGGHSYSDESNQGGQGSSEDREAEAASYEHILNQLVQERSIFDASSGSRGKRSCLSFKRRSLLNPSISSGNNIQTPDPPDTQPGHLSAEGLAVSAPTRYVGTLGNTSNEFEEMLPVIHTSYTVTSNAQWLAPRQPQMQSNHGSRKSIVFDSAFSGTMNVIPTAASACATNLRRGHSKPSTSTGNSPGISRRTSQEAGDDVSPRSGAERRKSYPDGFFGLHKAKRLSKSPSSQVLYARKEEGQEQEQPPPSPPQQQQQQQRQQDHDPEVETVEHLRPSCYELRMPLMDEVDRLLAQADTSFFFDTFALNDATSGHALSVLGFFLLNRTGMTSTFKISLPRLARFLRKVEARMKVVPYHNAVHVADVLQTLHAMSTLGGLSTAIADPLFMLSAYFAAIIHDFEHPGVTNAFLIATESPLAMRYNDSAPLEQHHLSGAFSVLKEQDLMPSLPKPEYLHLRKVVIDMVLATDMAKHMDIYGRISTLAALVSASSMSSNLSSRHSNSGPLLVSPFSRATAQVLDKRRSHNLLSPEASLKRESLDITSSGNNLQSGSLALDESKKILLLQVALKCADLGHMAESWDVHSRWVSKLEEEFFHQGDREKVLDLPVSPLCDRDYPGVAKSQEGFINFVLAPLFQAYVTILPDAQPMLQAIEANGRHWAEQSS